AAGAGWAGVRRGRGAGGAGDHQQPGRELRAERGRPAVAGAERRPVRAAGARGDAEIDRGGAGPPRPSLSPGGEGERAAGGWLQLRGDRTRGNRTRGDRASRWGQAPFFSSVRTDFATALRV